MAPSPFEAAVTFAKNYFIEAVGAVRAEAIMQSGMVFDTPKERLGWYRTCVEELEERRVCSKKSPIKDITSRKYEPVPLKKFIEDAYFMDAKGILYPEVLRCMEEMNNGDYQETVLTGAIGCVDADTECLTPRGWVRVADYLGGPIAQYHLSGEATFVDPEDYVQYPETKFNHFKTKYGLDMALSDEHRVLYLDKAGNPKEMSAGELRLRHTEAKYGFRGKFITTFVPKVATTLPIEDATLRVIIMVCADGHFPAHLKNTYCVLRLKKERKIIRARALLGDAGITWKERNEESTGFVVFTFHAPVREKSLSVLWGASYAQLQLIAEEVLHWDGEVARHQFFTCDKPSADLVQYAFSATGRRAVLETFVRGGRIDYVVRGNPNTLITMAGTPKTEVGEVPALDGKKYCFTVPTSYWVARRNGKVFVTGNTGKSTIALYSTAYQLYLLSCYWSPHSLFGLDPSSEIVFIFQSINATLAKSVDYMRFKAMIEKSPYFREKFPFDKYILSELRFPNRIIVKPVSGAETGAIGQNVIGGVIDEMNFMAVVENSKANMDGGTYDQAIALYNSIARRRKSRFMAQGKLPGLLCLVSSKRYPGQFTDKKEEESKREIDRTGKTTIYVYDKRTWDIKPEGSFSGNWFMIFIGDESRKPRILDDGEEMKLEEAHLYMEIPEEYRNEFETDMMNALRDIAGVSTLATHPFITDRESISTAMRQNNILFSRTTVDFVETKLDILVAQMFKKELPRFIHCDLAVTGDSAGVCIGTVIGFKKIERNGVTEVLPNIWIDAVLEVKPPKGGEILFYKIREVLYALTKLGMNLKWVTFDQFQSVDSMQILRQQGYTVGRQSVDETTAPYDFVKNALYDERLSIPDHKKLAFELASLEKDTKKNKIDHPPHASKDVGDALAGVVYGLTTRREIWSLYDIPLGSIPGSLVEAMSKKAKSDKAGKEGEK